MIIHTKAIVLSATNYQESSRIAGLFTLKYGKVSVISQGARSLKNSQSSALQPGTILDVVFYYKPGRSVQKLTQSTTSCSPLAKHNSVERMTVLYSILELFSQVAHENDSNEEMFEFLERLISWYAAQPEPLPALIPYAQVRMAALGGFSISAEEGCNSTLPVFFGIEAGVLSNSASEGMCYRLEGGIAEFLLCALRNKNSQIFEINLSINELKQLVTHLDVYFKYHIEGFKNRKSDEVFNQLMQFS